MERSTKNNRWRIQHQIYIFRFGRCESALPNFARCRRISILNFSDIFLWAKIIATLTETFKKSAWVLIETCFGNGIITAVHYAIRKDQGLKVIRAENFKIFITLSNNILLSLGLFDPAPKEFWDLRPNHFLGPFKYIWSYPC